MHVLWHIHMATSGTLTRKYIIQVLAGLGSHLVRCCDGLIMYFQLCCPPSDCSKTAQLCLYSCVRNQGPMMLVRRFMPILEHVPRQAGNCCLLRLTSVRTIPPSPDKGSLFLYAMLFYNDRISNWAETVLLLKLD